MTRDLGVTVALREHLPEWAVEAFAALALLGDLIVIVPLLGLLYLLEVGSNLRSDRLEEPLCSERTVFLIATVFGGLAFVVLVKGSFALPRPPADLHAVETSKHGFPSGHVMAATIFWGALALWLERAQLLTRVTIATLVLAIVALSRLALGVHYLVDVVASVAFGILYLAVIGYVVGIRPLRVFLVAIAIAALALVVTGGETRAILALVGTVGAVIGWQLVELPVVRRTLTRA
ncbi:phosphatase PAP2 family protein [Natrialbaceae archaeon A-CW1-1]